MLRRERRQQGFALLIMLVIVVMGSMFAVTSQLEFVSRKYSRDEATLKSLAMAKEALLGYAVTYRDNNSNDVFGYLPCPDIATGDGTAAASCGSANNAAVGLFPYKTLGLPDLRDSDGGCLWYAVSGPAKNSPKATTTVMNWDTQGQFSFAGTSIAPEQGDGGAVAVIFAPGLALAGQSRSPSGSYPCNLDPTQAAAYLDGNYNFATSSVVAITPGASGSASNNDQIAWITSKEIFDKVVGRADFSNPLTSSPVGQINKLSDEVKALLEKKIQDDVVAGTTSLSAPRNTGSYTQPSGKQVGDLQSGLSLSTAYANYYSNWMEQYRQVTCNPITACLTIAGTNCRGALMFGGRSSTTNGFTASGQPLLTAQKSSSTANLSYYFEASGGLPMLNSATTTFTGSAAYTASGPSTDFGLCLVPGVIDSFAQDIATYFRTTTSAVTPQAAINVGAQTVTIGNTGVTATGSGCVWFPTQLPFNSLLRAYFQLNIATHGEGFIYAIIDGPNNQTAINAGSLCGGTTQSHMGYGSPVAAPKFGLEIDTRVQSTANCTGSNRNDSSSDHMAFVYWGAAATTTDDNCHGSTAGTLGSGSEPLNPRTLSTSALTPATTVGTAVSAASWSNNVAVVTTSAAHGRSTNEQVTVSGVSPSGYTGTYQIEVINATQFAYPLATNPGTYASGGTVAIYAGIKNVQLSDTMLPYSGTLPTATNIHVRVDATKNYGATTIQAASWSGGTALVTTPTAHGLLVGQRITTSGYAAGTYAIASVPTTTSLTFALAGDPGAYTSGGSFNPPLGLTVAAATRAAAGSAWKVNIQTSAAHGFVSGQPVTIAGVTPAAYNGTAQILVVDATNFTYALAADPGAYTSGGTLTAAVALQLKAYVATNFPSCTSTDFKNLSQDLSNLCAQNPTIQQNNVYMNVDAVTGKVLDTIYSGFTNAESTSLLSKQSITVSNFIIRTQ